jgi:lipopolysaccharide transport system permease protein
MSGLNQAPPLVIIRPRAGWQPLRLRELAEYWELLVTLAIRDIRVRYKQTVLGVAWAVIQPLAQMLVFSAFFASHGFSTDGAPASVFYYTGLLPWQLFATGLSSASNSLVSNRGLVTKIYFPRLVLPLSAVVGSLVDLGCSFVVLLVIMAFSHFTPSANIIYLPLFIVLGATTSLTIGLWLSALNAEFRDVQYVVPFVVQFWLFVTPVIYPSSSIVGRKHLLLALNPMSGVVEGFRWCLIGRPTPGAMLVASIATVGFLLVTGLLFFRRMERTLADVL